MSADGGVPFLGVPHLGSRELNVLVSLIESQEVFSERAQPFLR